jgi:hypothetical protein
MKNLMTIFIGSIIVILLSSCGVNHAYMINLNQNSTQVHLGSRNFKVVERVSGSADVSYVLIFGGMNKRRLYENAYAAMLKDANLLTGSKALAHFVAEEHVGGVPPFYFTRTITVSAYVIEFTD